MCLKGKRVAIRIHWHGTRSVGWSLVWPKFNQSVSQGFIQGHNIKFPHFSHSLYLSLSLCVWWYTWALRGVQVSPLKYLSWQKSKVFTTICSSFTLHWVITNEKWPQTTTKTTMKTKTKTKTKWKSRSAAHLFYGVRKSGSNKL